MELVVAKESPSPIHQQIFDQIRKAIIQGEIQANSKLPSERDLADKLGISRMTIRRAFERLANGGFIRSMGGKGVFVSPPKINQSVEGMMNFFSDMRDRGLTPESKLLSIEKVKPSKEVSDFLYDRDEDEVLRIERLLLANKITYAHETKYLNYRKCLQLKERNYVITGSDFKFLDECIRCWINARVTIGIEKLDHVSAKNLGFENCRLVFLVSKQVYTFENKPLSLISAKYRSDSYNFKLNLFNYHNLNMQNDKVSS